MCTRATVPWGLPNAPRIPVCNLCAGTETNADQSLSHHSNLDHNSKPVQSADLHYVIGQYNTQILVSVHQTQVWYQDYQDKNLTCIAAVETNIDSQSCRPYAQHSYLSAPAHDNILLMRSTWKGWRRILRWNWSLPQCFTMYLLAQMRPASRASLDSCSYSSETK